MVRLIESVVRNRSWNELLWRLLWSGNKIVVKSLKSFVADESGATAIEYGLIAALIAVFLIGALSALGTSMSSEYAVIGAAMR
jgi:pilus assembly protein Flp/PilA